MLNGHLPCRREQLARYQAYEKRRKSIKKRRMTRGMWASRLTFRA